MPLWLYHALWMTLALGVIAVASAWIARRLLRRAARRDEAEAALDALARYSEWLAVQRRAAEFTGDLPAPASPLMEVLRLQQRSFPELAFEVAGLLALHARTLDVLWRQQLLRQRDPEAWLESDPDKRFMVLWREHRAAIHGLADQLRAVAGGPLVDAEPESVFPA